MHCSVASTLMDHLLISESYHPSRAYASLHFPDQPGPVPGAHKTDGKSQIDQVKGSIGECQDAQCIHQVKLYAIIDVMSHGLLTSIGEKMLVEIDPHQRHLGISPGSFNDPTTWSACNIKHVAKGARVSLLGKDPAHRCGNVPILAD